MEREPLEADQASVKVRERPRLNSARSPKAIIHRDQVHGDVTYDPLAVNLLNTNTLQRLGKVFQLGYAHLVFRGGTHTRLSHVMGAAHMAGKIVDALKSNYKQKRAARPRHVAEPSDFLPIRDSADIDQRWEALRHLVVWAGLLHDVGHIPIGHTLEDEFDGIYKKHDDFASPRASHLWRETGEIFLHLTNEALLPRCLKDLKISGRRVWQTVMLICFYKDVKPDDARNFHDFPTYLAHRLNILAQDISTQTTKLKKAEEDSHKVDVALLEEELDSLNREKAFTSELRDALEQTLDIFQPYMVDIVGNTICADYLDYLRRDPLNVGLDVLRDDRILSNFYVSMEPRAEPKRYRMALALVDRHGKPRFDVCTGVIEQVRQRFRFAESIYYHKTKVSASAMFAKAISLIGQPDEIGRDEMELSIGTSDFSQIADGLLNGSQDIQTVRAGCLPSALLHTGLGDETLHYLMMQRAFENIEKELKDRAPAGARAEEVHESSSDHEVYIEAQLRGVALLRGITQRQLYKVCVSINSKQFGDLTRGARTETAVEDRLNAMLQRLRKDGRLRARIEKDMADAVKWPMESVLLYAPPRKSQAKGVETFAFDKDGVVRLNDHPVVMEKVAELGRDYKNLWRLLVLVHPDLRERKIELSEITDVLVRELWSEFGVEEALLDMQPSIETLRDITWFTYIRAENREAARRMESFFTDSKGRLLGEVDWDLFERAPIATTHNRSALAPREYAERGYVLQVAKEKLVEALDSVDEAERQAVFQLNERYPQSEVKIAPTTLPGLTLSGPNLYASEGTSLTADQMATLSRTRELNALAEEISEAARRSAKRPTPAGRPGGGRKRQVTKKA